MTTAMPVKEPDNAGEQGGGGGAAHRLPRVSIGLVAYNEERFIRRTVESLLAQDFTDFELIISDNASSDRTEEICREFVSRDPRVSYHRNAENIGAAGNVNRVAGMASGEYFLPSCAHDLYDPTFLSKAVRILESDPGVVLCHSDCLFIDEGDKVFMAVPRQVDTRGKTTRARYNAAIWTLACYVICGLHRMSVLRQVLPMRQVMGADNLVLAELSFLGAFANIPEDLFFLRTFRTPGDMPAVWKRLINEEVRIRRYPALFWRYARNFLGVVARRSGTPSERVCLVASTLLRLAKGACGFFGSLAFSACFPRTYARVMRWLVRRHGGQEWHERKGSDGAAVQ